MAAVKFQVPACLAPLDPDRLVQRCCPHRARKAYARARRSRRSGRLLKKLVAAVELALAVLLVAVVWLLSTNGSLPTRARASGGGGRPEPRLMGGALPSMTLHLTPGLMLRRQGQVSGDGYIGIDPISVSDGAAIGIGRGIRSYIWRQPRLMRSAWATMVHSRGSDRPPPIPQQIFFSHRFKIKPESATGQTMGSWAVFNPEHALKYFNDSAVETLVLKYLPRAAFDSLSNVEKIDVFRYAVIYERGGVYTDTDVFCRCPIAAWTMPFVFGESIESLDFVIGLEFATPQLVAAGKPGTNVPLQFLQWTFVSSPQNPLLHFVLRRVTTAISAIPFVADDKATLERTGPKVFSRAILDFIGEFGSTPGMFDYGNHKYPLALIPANELEQSGQVLELKGIYRGKPFELRGLVLPVRAFGFHSEHVEVHRYQEDHLVEHRFLGSWRANGDVFDWLH